MMFKFSPILLLLAIDEAYGSGSSGAAQCRPAHEETQSGMAGAAAEDMVSDLLFQAELARKVPVEGKLLGCVLENPFKFGITLRNINCCTSI